MLDKSCHSLLLSNTSFYCRDQSTARWVMAAMICMKLIIHGHDRFVETLNHGTDLKFYWKSDLCKRQCFRHFARLIKRLKLLNMTISVRIAEFIYVLCCWRQHNYITTLNQICRKSAAHMFSIMWIWPLSIWARVNFGNVINSEFLTGVKRNNGVGDKNLASRECLASTE